MSVRIRLRGVQVLPLWTILHFPWLHSGRGSGNCLHFYHRLSFWRASKSHDTFHNADVALAWFHPISPVSSCPELVSSDQFVHPLVLWGHLYCRVHPHFGACMEAGFFFTPRRHLGSSISLLYWVKQAAYRFLPPSKIFSEGLKVSPVLFGCLWP